MVFGPLIIVILTLKKQASSMLMIFQIGLSLTMQNSVVVALEMALSWEIKFMYLMEHIMTHANLIGTSAFNRRIQIAILAIL